MMVTYIHFKGSIRKKEKKETKGIKAANHSSSLQAMLKVYLKLKKLALTNLYFIKKKKIALKEL